MAKSKPRSAKTNVSPAAWARVQLFAMDVDGVLTDGRVTITSDGKEAKQFSILDGLGLVRLGRFGIHVAWISGRASGATTARGNELKIPHLIQGRVDKITALQELAEKLGLTAQQCVYMGDDVIDVEAMLWAGIAVSVPDAMPVALTAADYITRRPAGFGAVREVCELIAAARGLTFTG